MYLIYESNECSMIDIVLTHPEEGIISRLHCQFLFSPQSSNRNTIKCVDTCDVRLVICLHLNNKTFFVLTTPSLEFMVTHWHVCVYNNLEVNNRLLFVFVGVWKQVTVSCQVEDEYSHEQVVFKAVLQCLATIWPRVRKLNGECNKNPYYISRLYLNY